MVPRDMVLGASSVTLGACDNCAAIHINLCDADGTVFATASLPAEHWQAFRMRFDTLAIELACRSPAPAMQQ